MKSLEEDDEDGQQVLETIAANAVKGLKEQTAGAEEPKKPRKKATAKQLEGLAMGRKKRHEQMKTQKKANNMVTFEEADESEEEEEDDGVPYREILCEKIVPRHPNLKTKTIVSQEGSAQPQVPKKNVEDQMSQFQEDLAMLKGFMMAQVSKPQRTRKAPAVNVQITQPPQQAPQVVQEAAGAAAERKRQLMYFGTE